MTVFNTLTQKNIHSNYHFIRNIYFNKNQDGLFVQITYKMKLTNNTFVKELFNI